MHPKCWSVIYFTYITLLHDCFFAGDSVTTHVHFSRSQKVAGVLQREICFIKSNNWLKCFPLSLQFHTNGPNSSHMRRSIVFAVRSPPGRESERSNQRGRRRDLLSDWVKWFPLYKACLPFFNSSDSYEFPNGNLASRVLTEIVLPKHLKQMKCMVWGVESNACTMQNVSLWIIFHLIVSCFVKTRCANNAKETRAKCQSKQFQLTQ